MLNCAKTLQNGTTDTAITISLSGLQSRPRGRGDGLTILELLAACWHAFVASNCALLRRLRPALCGVPLFGTMRSSGSVGACSQAPNAVTVGTDGNEKLHKRLVMVKSVAVVEAATGKASNIEDPAMWEHLGAARRMRMRRSAKEEKRWNKAEH